MEIFTSIRGDALPQGAGDMPEDRQSSPDPAIRPGQIWLIEQLSATVLFSFDRDALTSADVVIYDRALAPLVARFLPIGAYAEPWSPDVQATGSTISARALQFAAEGWSVVQLVEARPGRRERLRDAVGALKPLSGGNDLPLVAIAKTTAGRHRRWEGCLRNSSDLIDEFGDDDPLTLVFGPLVIRHPAPAYAFAANGLAG
jgi:siroheme synthase